MGTKTSQITSLTIVYSTVHPEADQRKHQSSASLAFVWGIHRVPVNSPHKWPVTRKMFPFDDVIMHENYLLPPVPPVNTICVKSTVHLKHQAFDFCALLCFVLVWKVISYPYPKGYSRFIYNIFDFAESMGEYYWCVKIQHCGYTGHGLKDIAFYVQKHISYRVVCHNFSLVRDKPQRAPAFVRLVDPFALSPAIHTIVPVLVKGS